MSNLEDLQGRILYAMERIGAGLDRLEPARPAEAEGETPEALQRALEDERTANAQLEERVKALHRRQEELEQALAAAEAAPQASGEPDPQVAEAMIQMDEDMSRLRAANAALRENNRLLREAQGAATTEQLNEALAAELEALRADHAAAEAEAATIKAALVAMIEQAPDVAADVAAEKGEA
ncbi:hypothetical protein KUV28_01465 [Ferrimonas balearica]|nr:hypothetical protein [Ferrimonas balearica]